MTRRQAQILEGYSGLNKEVRFKHKDRRRGSWTVGIIDREVSVTVADYKHVLQRIRFAEGISWDKSKYAYRTGYYTWTADQDRVVWGQFHQLLSEKDFCALLKKARAGGCKLPL